MNESQTNWFLNSADQLVVKHLVRILGNIQSHQDICLIVGVLEHYLSDPYRSDQNVGHECMQP